MSWLVMSWALLFGFVPNQVDAILSSPAEWLRVGYQNQYVTSLHLQADMLRHVRIEGEVETYESIDLDGGFQFNPYRADYTFGIALYARGFEIGIRHECDHGIEFSNASVPWYGKAESQIYVKISGKTNF